MLSHLLSRFWWMTLLRGVLWILFGIMVFTKPGISLATLTLLFGAFVLADGVVGVVNAIAGHKKHDDWVLMLLGGLAGIFIGIITFIAPGITVLTLLFYIAIWAIATGVLALVAAIRLRKEIQGEFWLVLAGLASIVFGMIVIARPGEGILSVLWLLACFSVALGIALVGLAFRVRRLGKNVEAMKPKPA
jgi:uncharacterized membrane protein HdeD (DUF308 family)